MCSVELSERRSRPFWICYCNFIFNIRTNNIPWNIFFYSYNCSLAIWMKTHVNTSREYTWYRVYCAHCPPFPLISTKSPVFFSPVTMSVIEWEQQTQRFTLSLKSILFPHRCFDQPVEVVCAATHKLYLTGFLRADSISVFDGAPGQTRLLLPMSL